MKVRDLMDLLRLQNGDAEVRVVVEPIPRRRDEARHVAPEFEIDKVDRENFGRARVNIIVW